MHISLENQVAVITGGSRGIGAATVRALAEAGARVVFSFLQAEREAQNLVFECGGSDQGGGRACRRRKMADAKRLVTARSGALAGWISWWRTPACGITSLCPSRK